VVKLYVEGGGDSNALRTACREGFTTFLTKAGLSKRPRIVACGSRADAFDAFCTAIKDGDEALLLVDSEEAVADACQHPESRFTDWKPWAHLQQRAGDGWEKPEGASDADCHLMTQCMETWLLADSATLASFFGAGFRLNELPAKANAIESLAKLEIFRSLQRATRDCKTKRPYGKGEHSFKLLAAIDPARVIGASPWAKRFIETLAKKMSS
jgi:hypothetical protein